MSDSEAVELTELYVDIAWGSSSVCEMMYVVYKVSGEEK